MRALLVALVLLVPLRAAAQPTAATPSPTSVPTFDVAHRPVSTHSAVAQRAFDEGLTLLDAFNPAEARQAFRRAIAADPDLAMAYWGVAMSYGLNINTAYNPADQRLGHEAIGQAQARTAGATDAERALIAAAVQRYAFTAAGDADRSARAFRDAMATAAAQFPSDDDILTLAAESELDLQPWDQWTKSGQPRPGTQAAIAGLQTVLARDPGHIQAEHLLIHALEASPRPQGALDAARRLAAYHFEPAAEHLTHMPALTYMRVGEYAEAGASNVAALSMFDTYLDGPHQTGHESYRRHDCEFAVDALMMSGEYERARDAAAGCGDGSRRLLAYAAIRFHKWQDLAPVGSVTTYTDAVVAANAGHLDQAQRDERTLAADKGTTQIAAHVIQAEIDGARGRQNTQIVELVSAVALQDQLDYREPPQWYFPVRETLGAAYYAAGDYPDAERVFRDDLLRNPRNPRSLYGLAQTLEREGKTADVAAAERDFAQAWKHADVTLTMQDL